MNIVSNKHLRPPAFRLGFGTLAAAFVLALATATLPAAAQQTTLKAMSLKDMSLNDRLELCSACHGADGNSKMEKIPSLAGQPEFFLLNQLVLMREGVRRIEVMEDAIKGLKDEDIQALATHFSKLVPKPSEEKIETELVSKGEAMSKQLRCASCHLPTMAGQEQMPRLAKQRVDYMFEAMKQYRDNKRAGADTAMTAVIVGIGDGDLEALAHYVSSR